MELLGARGNEWHFAWLLRVGRDVAGTMPDHARIRTWQQVATALNDWLRSQDNAFYGPALVKQYIQHLEDKQLASTHGLTTNDALAVNLHERAKTAVAAVLDQARERILQEWGVRKVSGRDDQSFSRSTPWRFWQHVEIPNTSGRAEWHEPAFLSWGCGIDDLRAPEHRRGEYAIWAGVVCQALPDRDDEWLKRRHDERFEYARPDISSRIYQWLPLREIAETPGFAEQVDLVVDRVQSAFDLLVADPPPASAQERPPAEQPVE
jgi:hypothetical protein